MLFYAVHKGVKSGIIVKTWGECKELVEGYPHPIYKKFLHIEDAKKFAKEGFPTTFQKIKKEADSLELSKNEPYDEDKNIYIYTDGSLKKTKNGVLCGYGIFIRNVVEISAPFKNGKITNNRAELYSIISSITYLSEEDLKKKIFIYTDSKYCMLLYYRTGERYEKEKYMDKDGKECLNCDLIKQLLDMKRKYPNIQLVKIESHTGKSDVHSLGNERADELANKGGERKELSIHWIVTHRPVIHAPNDVVMAPVPSSKITTLKGKNLISTKLTNFLIKL